MGKKVKCDSEAFNIVLDCPDDIDDDCQPLIRTTTLQNMKKWLDPLISDGAPKCLEVRGPIEMKDLNIAARRDRVPIDAKKDVEVIPTSSIYIQKIEEKYLISSDAALPPRPVATAVTRTPLTQAILLQIGQVAHSADRQAARLEASISGMIQTALANCMTTLSATIDALVVRIGLKSIDMSMIFGMVEIPDVPNMPPATIEDEARVEKQADPEFEVETDEEMLEVAEEDSYEGLTKIEEAMVDEVVQASLVDTPLADPSAASVPSKVTPGTDAQV
ncbi:hypothetical protein H5410_030809 [Solanum commersonii]|uniref:Polyprotein protein n=1 Tax=Solanum commersonii TaxID=4109 RepID=A0A9J5YI09_SOLCO|nr:hypothetical protein H5410_030809 [Solanum commersonii]